MTRVSLLRKGSCSFLNIWIPCAVLSFIAQSCPTLCDPMDYSLPGTSIHGTFWLKISFVFCQTFLDASISVYCAFFFLNFSSFCEWGIMHTSHQTHIFVKVWTLKCEPGQACLSTTWESAVLNIVVFTHKTLYSQFNNLACILYELWSMASVASKITNLFCKTFYGHHKLPFMFMVTLGNI